MPLGVSALLSALHAANYYVRFGENSAGLLLVQLCLKERVEMSASSTPPALDMVGATTMGLANCLECVCFVAIFYGRHDEICLITRLYMHKTTRFFCFGQVQVQQKVRGRRTQVQAG